MTLERKVALYAWSAHMRIVFHGPQRGAYLQQTKSGRVLLCLDNTAYVADDVIPSGGNLPEVACPGGNARRFVSRCMIVAYGRDEAGWPPLAKKFLSEMQAREVRKPYLVHVS